MIILSIDIGIKNLAVAQIEVLEDKCYNILSWDLLNIGDPPPPKIICSGFFKNGKPCTKVASYKNKVSFFCKSHAPDGCKLIVKRKAKKPTINDVCKRLIVELDKNEHYLKSQKVLIENQPCLMNPMIKSVQIMVFTYFHMRSNNIAVQLIHANRKNRIFKDDPDPDPPVKSKYLRTKKKGIVACKKLLCQTKDVEFFGGHSKKDDLSDAFLQAWAYLYY